MYKFLIPAITKIGMHRSKERHKKDVRYEIHEQK